MLKTENRKFKTSVARTYVDGKATPYDRYIDTEAKFFEFLCDNNIDKVKGLYMLSEKAMCESCEYVAIQFIKMHPNIKINVISGKTLNTWKER